MSREEFVQKLREMISLAVCKDCQWQVDTLADQVNKEIERLLADERKAVLGELLAFNSQLGCTPQEGYKDLTDALRDTKHLLADIRRDEREKVREMCALVASDPYGDIVEALGDDEPYRVAVKIAKAIRQLDLTKDLAASSREEGNERT